jgi:hypothetical protein
MVRLLGRKLTQTVVCLAGEVANGSENKQIHEMTLYHKLHNLAGTERRGEGQVQKTTWRQSAIIPERGGYVIAYR